MDNVLRRKISEDMKLVIMYRFSVLVNDTLRRMTVAFASSSDRKIAQCVIERFLFLPRVGFVAFSCGIILLNI